MTKLRKHLLIYLPKKLTYTYLYHEVDYDLIRVY